MAKAKQRPRATKTQRLVDKKCPAGKKLYPGHEIPARPAHWVKAKCMTIRAGAAQAKIEKRAKLRAKQEARKMDWYAQRTYPRPHAPAKTQPRHNFPLKIPRQRLPRQLPQPQYNFPLKRPRRHSYLPYNTPRKRIYQPVRYKLNPNNNNNNNNHKNDHDNDHDNDHGNDNYIDHPLAKKEPEGVPGNRFGQGYTIDKVPRKIGRKNIAGKENWDGLVEYDVSEQGPGGYKKREPTKRYFNNDDTYSWDANHSPLSQSQRNSVDKDESVRERERERVRDIGINKRMRAHNKQMEDYNKKRQKTAGGDINRVTGKKKGERRGLGLAMKINSTKEIGLGLGSTRKGLTKEDRKKLGVTLIREPTFPYLGKKNTLTKENDYAADAEVASNKEMDDMEKLYRMHEKKKIRLSKRRTS